MRFKGVILGTKSVDFVTATGDQISGLTIEALVEVEPSIPATKIMKYFVSKEKLVAANFQTDFISDIMKGKIVILDLDVENIFNEGKPKLVGMQLHAKK